MVHGTEKKKRQIFNLLTFWVIAGFTLLGQIDYVSPHESDGLIFLNTFTRCFALLLIYSIAAPSNRKPFGAMFLTGLAWATTHILFAGFGDVEGPYLMLAVASTTTLIVNVFFEFDAKAVWQPPRWAGIGVLVLAGLVWFEGWEATREPDCVSSCHSVHVGDCINTHGTYHRHHDVEAEVVF